MVLIILAVISVNVVFGEDGIIKIAEKARQFQANAEAEDNGAMDEYAQHIANAMVEDGSGDDDNPYSGLEPGLYETGSNYTTILKDWDTLKSEGLITVSDKKLTSIDWNIVGDLVISNEVEELSNYCKYNEWMEIEIKILIEESLKLTGIVIPSSVKSIPDDSFLGADQCTNVIMYEGITMIGEKAFWGCSSLENIEIPTTVTSIGDKAFYNCSGLTSITIPASVTSIGKEAFHNYYVGLTSIIVDENNTMYDSRDNCNAIIEKSTNTLIQGCNNTTIPDSVTSIGEKAFKGCRGLTSIIIPDSVTSIGNEAFNYCKNLANVTIGNSVKNIGSDAFSGCSSLTSVTIPENVEKIWTTAFIGCTNLTEVIIDSKDFLSGYEQNNGYNIDEWSGTEVYYGDYLLYNATTVYIKEGIPEDFTINFTKSETSDKEGYVKYTKNS